MGKIELKVMIMTEEALILIAVILKMFLIYPQFVLTNYQSITFPREYDV